jgi:hypothetical protein
LTNFQSREQSQRCYENDSYPQPSSVCVLVINATKAALMIECAADITFLRPNVLCFKRLCAAMMSSMVKRTRKVFSGQHMSAISHFCAAPRLRPITAVDDGCGMPRRDKRPLRDRLESCTSSTRFCQTPSISQTMPATVISLSSDISPHRAQASAHW